MNRFISPVGWVIIGLFLSSVGSEALFVLWLVKLARHA